MGSAGGSGRSARRGKRKESGERMKIEQACNILAKTQLNDYTIQMKLAVGDMVRTSLTGPGQFVHIKCGHSRLLRRPISVCDWQSSPEGDALTIVFEVRGEGTAWLAGRPVGHSVDVLGLLGNGFDINPEGRYLPGSDFPEAVAS